MPEPTRTAEQVALEKHALLGGQPVLAYRFLDHNSRFVADHRHAFGEVNLVAGRLTRELGKSRYEPVGVHIERINERSMQLTETATRHLLRLKELLEIAGKKGGFQKVRDAAVKTFTPYVQRLPSEVTEASTAHWLEEITTRLQTKQAADDAAIKAAEAAPDAPKEGMAKYKHIESIRKKLAENKAVEDEELKSALMAFDAPHHARTLRELVNNPAFGQKVTEREKIVRALAYFSHAYAPRTPDKPVEVHSSLDASQLKEELKKLDKRDVISSLKSKLKTGITGVLHWDNYSVRGYNAVAMLLPDAIDRTRSFKFGNPVSTQPALQGLNPEGEEWFATSPTAIRPIQGLQILEPSVRAAQEVWQRYYESRWKDHPEEAFPIYDYRGRLVWPKPVKAH